MSSYSRIFHHITVEDVKRNKRERNVLEKIEEFKEEEIIEPLKHVDWREDIGDGKLEENMVTTALMNVVYPSMGEENLQTLANAEEASYSTTTYGNGDTAAPYGNAGSTPSGSSLNANGTGTGDGGGTGNFKVGGEGYAFIPMGEYGDLGWDGQLNLAPVDATDYDTIVIQAQVGDGTNGGRAPTDSYLDDPDLIGYGGIMVSYYLPEMDNTDANTSSWQLDATIDKYEPGYSRYVDPDYTDNLLPLWRDALPQGISQLREYSILIPPWAQKENVTFNIYGFGPFEGTPTGIGGDVAIQSVYFRRLKPLNVVASLDSPEATSFIHDGSPARWKGSREKKRRELARQLKQSNIYLEKKFGLGFPGTGALPPGEADRYLAASPRGKAEMRAQWASASGAPQTKYSDRLGGATALQKYGTTTAGRNRMRRGALNPFGQRERVRSGAAGRKRVPVYSGRSYRGKRGYGKTTYGTTDKRTAGTYTRGGWSKGIRGTGMSRGGTIDRGTLPQRYIDKYGSRSVTGQQQIKLGRKAAQKTFGPGKKTYVKRTPQSQATFRSNIEKATGQDPRSNVAGKPKQLTPKGTLKTRYPSSSRNWGRIAKNVGYGVARGVLRGVGGKYVKAATTAYDAYSTGKSAYKWMKSSQGKEARSRVSKGIKSVGKTFKSWANRSKKSTRGPNRYQRRSRYSKLYNDFELQGNTLMEFKLKKPKEFFNPADIKPEYPDESPPELTKRGYHPDLEAGEKVSKRYNKLDPISARSMPKTGNPHIDRKVAQAAKKPKDATEKKRLRSPKEMREGLTVA